ncbi:MAG TPA: hypothetical protein VMJ30_00685, partial [Gemmatimonadales bacterium]|nr:hypothetical protein [Gemmatimonadales bacterium]
MPTSFEAFVSLTERGGMVPVTHEVVLDSDTPVTAFAKLHRGRFGFLLESLEGGERWARYTFMATDPRQVLRYQGRRCERWADGGGWELLADNIAPLDHIGDLMRRTPAIQVPGLPRFTGGAVGYLGYDTVRSLESLPSPPPDDRGLPDALLMIADTLLVLDNLFNRATVIANIEVRPGAPESELRRLYDEAVARIADWLGRLLAPSPLRALTLRQHPALPVSESRYGEREYEDGVR